VSFNVSTTGTADKFFPNWKALVSQEEVRVVHVVLCFREGFEALHGFSPRGISPLQNNKNIGEEKYSLKILKNYTKDRFRDKKRKTV